MTAASRGHSALKGAFRKIPSWFGSRFVICSKCSSHQVILPRCGIASFSISAEATASTDTLYDELSPSQNSLLKIPTISSKTHDIHTGVILSRPPILTPNLHPFEKAFFFYQKRLNERLAVPFTRYFYFKKDTPANTDWKIKFKERGHVPAKELGTYNSYGRDSWNDELLVKEKHLVEPEYITDQLVKDARISVTEDGVVVQDESARAEGVERPNSRTTDSDQKMDFQRLDRSLDRTLYLVVRIKDTDQWGFPTGEVLGKENLRSAAERVLAESCGVNMNTWLVGHVPIAHHVNPSSPNSNLEDNQVPTKSKAVFFLKGRIMAGQADLTNNCYNLDNYRWLSKDEVARILPLALFNSVSNSMHER